MTEKNLEDKKMDSKKKSNLKKKMRRIRNITTIGVLFELIRKNLKLLLRTKSSALIILLGPLLVILLVSFSFNSSSLYDIRVGTYSDSYNELSNSLLNILQDKQFGVVKLDSKDSCMNKLKSNEIHICTIFPPDFIVGSNEDVEFYVDNSKINLVWVIMEVISSKFSTKSSELSLNMANSLVSSVRGARSDLNSKQSDISGLIENNKAGIDAINDMVSSMASLPIDSLVGKVGLTGMNQRIDDLIEENSLNSSLFDDFKVYVLQAMNETNNLEVELEMEQQKNLDYLTELKSSLLSDSNKVSSIKTTIDSVDQNLASAEGTNTEAIATPIKTSINPIAAEETHLSLFFPMLVVMIIMFIGLLLSSILVVREKNSPAYFRNFITPVSDFLFLLGDYLTHLLILSLQLAVIFAVALFFFKKALISVLLNSALVIFLLISVFVFLGMLVGYIFKSEETSTLATISIGSLLLFFSSAILPLEVLPEYIREFADLNPLVLGGDLLKRIMLFGASLESVSSSLILLISYTLLLGLMVFGARKVSKRRI